MAETPGAKEGAGPKKPAKGPVLLHGRYRIDDAKPLPDLDGPATTAFAVADPQAPDVPMFGLVCTTDLPPRTDVIEAIEGSHFPGMLPLVAWGDVDWPPLGRRCSVVVYERPLGGRVSDDINLDEEHVSAHELPIRFLKPLSNALREFSRRSVTHRAIRPDNVFYLDAGKTQVVLGDCVTAPPGLYQAAVLEPIQRSMAMPAGRGEGHVADDMFALGATLVFLVLGHDPVAKLDAKQLFTARAEKGSYATLCASNRIPVYLLDALRGLLNDHADERWGTADLDRWIEQGHLALVRRKRTAKAEVPFTFMDKQHVTLRTLSQALAEHPSEAAAVIKGGELETWLSRAMQVQTIADAIAETGQLAAIYAGEYRGSDDYVAARGAILLDPEAPIRFRGAAFLPEAFGTALAVAVLRDGTAQAIVDALINDLPAVWFGAQTENRGTNMGLSKFLQKMRVILLNKNPGYGIERCLYILNPSLACQSPLIVHEHVVGVLDLLPALDRAAGRADPKTPPLDRHLIGFIAARSAQDVNSHLDALADPGTDKIVTLLNLYTFLQWRLRAGPLYGLAAWLAGLLGPAISTYHNRETRHAIEHDIPRLVRHGKLSELYDAVENRGRRRLDTTGYDHARAEFMAAEREIEAIQSGEATRDEVTMLAGQKTAAVSSVVIAMIATSIFIILDIF